MSVTCRWVAGFAGFQRLKEVEKCSFTLCFLQLGLPSPLLKSSHRPDSPSYCEMEKKKKRAFTSTSRITTYLNNAPTQITHHEMEKLIFVVLGHFSQSPSDIRLYGSRCQTSALCAKQASI